MKIIDTPRTVNLLEHNATQSADFSGPVVRLVGFDTASFTDEFRDWLFSAQDGDCGYCGISLGETWSGNTNAHVEHIKPRRLGGADAPPNLMFSCKSCNSTKGNNHFRSLHLKWAVRNSELQGVISVDQAQKLIDLGVLDIVVGTEFHFEIMGWTHMFPLPCEEEHKVKSALVYNTRKRRETLVKD